MTARVKPYTVVHARNRKLLCLIFAALIVWFLTSGSLSAQAPMTLNVRIGFHDQFVPDQYTPIRVQITYQGPPLTGELVLRQEIRRPLHPPRSLEMKLALQLGSNTRQLHVLYFPLSAYPAAEEDEPELSVMFLVEGQEIAANRIRLLDAVRSEPFVLVVSDTSFPRVLPTGEQIEQVEGSELPSDWKGYASVRRLYVGRFYSRNLTPEQQVALEQWLSRGGELVVLTGDNFYVQDAPWLRRLLPLDIDEIQRVETLGARIVVGRSRGEVIYEQEGFPLLVRGQQGRGTIYVAALNLLEPSTVQRSIWAKLSPSVTELPTSSPLGTELFREMELQLPPKAFLGGLLALYAAGFGLLSLWLLRRPRWVTGSASEMQALVGIRAHGWGVFVLLVSWIGLFAGLTLSYLQKPEFTRPAQSLEVSLIRGDTRIPWAWMQSWYSVFPKRTLSLELPLERPALVLPQEETSLTVGLQPERLQLEFSPTPLEAWKPQYLYLEDMLPLQIQLEVDEKPGDVRTPAVRVYNASNWALRDAVLVQRGIFYLVGDLPPGKAKEVALGDGGASSWPSAGDRRGGSFDFEGRVKERLYSMIQPEIQAQLKRGDGNSVLLAWASEEGFPVQPHENRWILKLLLIVATREG